jgi:hypothetical protein
LYVVAFLDILLYFVLIFTIQFFAMPFFIPVFNLCSYVKSKWYLLFKLILVYIFILADVKHGENNEKNEIERKDEEIKGIRKEKDEEIRRKDEEIRRKNEEINKLENDIINMRKSYFIYL